ncbi:RhoGAP-domain-containing protein, partial [Aureobasidium melanogenum]
SIAKNSISEERTPVAPTPALAFPTTTPASVVAPSPAVQPSHPVPLAPEVISASSSEATTPLATHGTETMGLLQREHTQSSTTPLHIASPTGDRRMNPADRSPSGTPSRAILDFLKPSPGGNSDSERREGRKPNKLQKKRIPGSTLSSAHSSAHSLQHEPDSLNDYFASPTTPVFESRAQDYVNEHGNDRSAYATAQTSPKFMTPQRTETDATLRPTVSP